MCLLRLRSLDFRLWFRHHLRLLVLKLADAVAVRSRQVHLRDISAWMSLSCEFFPRRSPRQCVRMWAVSPYPRARAGARARTRAKERMVETDGELRTDLTVRERPDQPLRRLAFLRLRTMMMMMMLGSHLSCGNGRAQWPELHPVTEFLAYMVNH